MNEWMQGVLASLEKQKEGYVFAYFDKKKGKIILVKDIFNCSGKSYVDYSDGVYGKHILLSKTESWQFLGML